jgi:hypothetical protein
LLIAVTVAVAVPTAGAEDQLQPATIVVSSLPLPQLSSEIPLSRVVYYENYRLVEDLNGQEPFSIAVPVDAAATTDPTRSVQRVVGYSGNMNEGVLLQIRPIHAGGTYELSIYVGPVPPDQRRQAVEEICARTPAISDVSAQATRYFVCRRIALDSTSEDITTFKALKGWWEAGYVLSTSRAAYIAPDLDALARVEEQLSRSPANRRFERVFDLDNLRREVLEVKSRSLADYAYFPVLLREGNLTAARNVYDAAAETFERLSEDYHLQAINGVSQRRLIEDGRLLEIREQSAGQ